jgi:hypothetical protein
MRQDVDGLANTAAHADRRSNTAPSSSASYDYGSLLSPALQLNNSGALSPGKSVRVWKSLLMRMYLPAYLADGGFANLFDHQVERTEPKPIAFDTITVDSGTTRSQWHVSLLKRARYKLLPTTAAMGACPGNNHDRPSRTPTLECSFHVRVTSFPNSRTDLKHLKLPVMARSPRTRLDFRTPLDTTPARPQLPPRSVAPSPRLDSRRPPPTTPALPLMPRYYKPAALFCSDARSSHFSPRGIAILHLRPPYRLRPASMAIDLQVERATRMALRLVLPSGAGPILSSPAVRVQQRERSNHSLGIVINTDFRLLEKFPE